MIRELQVAVDTYTLKFVSEAWRNETIRLANTENINILARRADSNKDQIGGQ